MVLEENKEFKIKRNDIVTRICDECNKSQKVTYGRILEARKNKNGKIVDYCKKCSYKYRELDHPKMEKSASWNGGRYLNENGYYRVYTGSENNNKYMYEHKLIYEKHIGRKLLVSEKVHHIDCDKKNNKIENLFLCANKAIHWKVHQSMEDCAISMINRLVWYNYENKIYTLKHQVQKKIKYDIKNIKKILSMKTYKMKKEGRNKYYLAPTSARLYPKSIHIMIAEEVFGRKLEKLEMVHHINGNTIDNSPENLVIMNKSEHKKCHCSLQECTRLLFNDNKVKFIDGKYVEIKEIK